MDAAAPNAPARDLGLAPPVPDPPVPAPAPLAAEEPRPEVLAATGVGAADERPLAPDDAAAAAAARRPAAVFAGLLPPVPALPPEREPVAERTDSPALPDFSFCVR